MSYYFIVDTYISEDGSGEYDDYIVQVKPIVEQCGGKYLVRTNTVVSLNEKRCPQRSRKNGKSGRKSGTDCTAGM